MNAPTSTTFPLDGLLICGQCGEPMHINDGLEPRYVCEPECSTPSLRAGGVDMMLIGQIMETVLTPRNTATLRMAAAVPLLAAGPAGTPRPGAAPPGLAAGAGHRGRYRRRRTAGITRGVVEPQRNTTRGRDARIKRAPEPATTEETWR